MLISRAASASRAFARLDDTVRRLRQVVSGAAERWRVVVLDVDSRPQADVAAALAAADILVGVSGGGLANMVHMPPGGVVIEVSPCGAPTPVAYAQLAWPLGHTHIFFSSHCDGGRKAAVDIVSSPEFMALIAVVLPVEW